MKLSEILIAYRNKVNELKNKYSEDLKANNLTNLVKDPEYQKHMYEFSALCQYAFEKMTIEQEAKAKQLFGKDRIRVKLTNGDVADVNVSSPSRFMVFDNIDKYCDAILMDKEVVETLNDEISKGNQHKDLSLVGIKSRVQTLEREYQLNLKDIENRKKKDIDFAENLNNLNTAFIYSSNKCLEFEKRYNETNSIADKNSAGKYAGYLVALTKVAKEKINGLPIMEEGKSNFESLIDRELKDKPNYKITEEEVKSLKSLNKKYIAKHRAFINGILSKEPIANLFKGVNIYEKDGLAALEEDSKHIKDATNSRYNNEVTKLNDNFNKESKLIDNGVFPDLDEGFNPNNGVDENKVKEHHNFLDELERVDETVTANSYKEDYLNFMNSKGLTEGIEGTKLVDRIAVDTPDFNEDINWGDDLVSLHENRVNDLMNAENGINLNNSDTLINEIAAIKAEHNNRPWYQKFFGYFGKIGNELKEADRIAESVANRLNVDPKFIKEAVDETANITTRDTASTSKKYILKEELLRIQTEKEKLAKKEEPKKENVQDKKEDQDLEILEEKKLSEDFIKGIGDLGNNEGVNFDKEVINSIDDQYDFSLDYSNDKDFLAYDKMQTEEFKEDEKDYKYVVVDNIKYKLEEAVKIGVIDNKPDVKRTIEMNKYFDEVNENIVNNIGNYKEKKEIDLSDKFDFEVQKEVGDIFPVNQESLNQSLIQDLDEGDPPKSQKVVDNPDKKLELNNEKK